ncbi:MAG TPA: arginine N-succinyltransferase [Kofleriaceae bacterium]|nr:arginine N-succinyltransferase [Kofleriaceae bacterium]
MFVIRQSFRRDAEQILEVARHLDTVNLPADQDHIQRILELSDRAFAEMVAPEQREYLFVLEDTSTKKVIGTSMVHAQHGTRRAPHVYFHVVKEERYSETLDRYFVHQGLRIGYDYDGPTEIGGLILLPEYRGNPSGLGKLLSYVRFLFIAMHRPVFRDRVLSELLPPLEDNGTSVLWEHLGRRFTGLDYQEADLISKDNKEFIKALFPHDLIYVTVMPREVQAVIGEVGPATRGVEKILRRIGFEYAHQIDPFDGGPHFVARTDDVTLVRNARSVLVADPAGETVRGPWSVVASEPAPAAFRATATFARTTPEEIFLAPEERALLEISIGDTVWAVTP